MTDREYLLAEQMTALSVAFPGHKMTDKTIEVYMLDTEDIPLDKLERAFDECRRSCKFFPAVAEIRAHAGYPADPEAMAINDWITLNEAIKATLWQHSIDLPGPVAAAVESMGGLRRIWHWCHMDIKGDWQSFGRAQFIKAHTANQGASRELVHIMGELEGRHPAKYALESKARKARELTDGA